MNAEKILVIWDFAFLSEIFMKLLKLYNEKDCYLFYSFDEFFEPLNKIYEKFKRLYQILAPIEIENIIKEIANISINKNLETEIVLSIDKLKLFLGKYIFFLEQKNCLILENFIEKFNKYFYSCIPPILYHKENDKNNLFLIKENAKNNIYPYYKEYDLRFLIGKATLYYKEAFNATVIELINEPELIT